MSDEVPKDSGLQTPQPDQPIPTDQERFDKENEALRQEDESASEPSDEEGQPSND